MTVDALLLVPVKPLGRAKSRLRDPSVPGVEDLVLAMACDVLAAGIAARGIGEVVVITNDARVGRAATQLGARATPDRPDAGLNASLRAALADLGACARTGGVICQPADCPAVRPRDFAALVAAAQGGARRLFVSDPQGSGTTSLLSSDALLDPHYGPGSAAAHRAAGYVELRGPRWLRLSRDVDTPHDLRAALRLGAGRHTTAWAARTGFARD
jgi:2-phospho-L-lactate/phosphoenolpyruvate guanylyltransferase